MAIAPSNNLLNALSQLQGTRPAAPARPAPQASAVSAPVQNSFAAQLGSTDTAIRTRAAEQRPSSSEGFSAAVQNQSRPIPTRGGYLGQHVNILV
jgi:hypothetical protein